MDKFEAIDKKRNPLKGQLPVPPKAKNTKAYDSSDPSRDKTFKKGKDKTGKSGFAKSKLRTKK
jgi:hypothetical protein